jgi:uncharacterized membrane protein YeiB
MLEQLGTLGKIAGEGGVVTIMALILLAGVYLIVVKFMDFSQKLAAQHQELWQQMQEQMTEQAKALHSLTQAINMTEERLRSEMKALRREMEHINQEGRNRR